MANKLHISILDQGVKAWNLWRKDHLDIKPDFSGADFSRIDLSRIDLSEANLNHIDLYEANLFGSDLSRVDLVGANLVKAILSKADLRRAHLQGAIFNGAALHEANLHEANLSRAIFWGANLSGANLNGANLFRTDLSSANLTNANLCDARVEGTIFGAIDLSLVKGLDALNHRGPSTIGIDTIYLSKGDIPEVFLQGAGVDDNFITYISSLVGKPIDYYKCFISYSSHDQTFADRLYADLQSKGVRCWFAPEDLKTGDFFWDRIDESIRLYDKLLIVLSQHSVESVWVRREVMAALGKEDHCQQQVLFPIRLDDSILTTNTAWAADIRRQRHITDFTKWKEFDEYQKALNRLLRDLKAAPARHQ